MKKTDLIELLSSIIEEDAIISRVYNLFHSSYDYSLHELDEIIYYGIQNNYFSLENVDDDSVKYETIDWRTDNTYQEIVMIDNERFVLDLFDKKEVPKEFLQFTN